MAPQSGRYAAASTPVVADGWQLQRLTPPSRLFGANGLRTGPDGRLYVAQVSGSQISALDVATGAVATISPKGGAIVAPDDLVFDPDGNLYVTEITEGRVSVRAPDGTTRVLCGDMYGANPITFHQGRLFAGECRPDGRIMELDLDGGAPRIVLENVPMPNAMEVGPDGMLYIPVMGANEIWRVALDGGLPEKVAGDLGVPDAVKFDAEGFIVSTQVHSGQVLRIDPRSGARTVLAELSPGLDNLDFAGERLFVSNFTGAITEIVRPGETRELLPGGLNWPLGLAMDAHGVLYVADGPFSYSLRPARDARAGGDAVHARLPGLQPRHRGRGAGRAGRDHGQWPGRALVACAAAQRNARGWLRPALRGGHRARRDRGVRRGGRGPRAVGARGPRRGAGERTARTDGRGAGAGRQLLREREQGRARAAPARRSSRHRAGRPAGATGHRAAWRAALRGGRAREDADRIRYGSVGFAAPLPANSRSARRRESARSSCARCRSPDRWVRSRASRPPPTAPFIFPPMPTAASWR